MKLVIVDDTAENLNAAKEAARNFPEHEFVFTSSATEAVKLLPDVDGIVTDLFFPPEGHHEHGNPLFYPYNKYEEDMSGAAFTTPFDEVVATTHYRGDRSQAERDLHVALDLVYRGTIRGALEDLIQVVRGWGGDVSKYRERLENLPAPQFPYGVAVMFAAKEAGKRHVLVTDMHHHAGDYTSASSAINGLVLLIPLVAKGIMKTEDVLWDGGDSATYMGSDRVSKLAGDIRPSKTSPAVWAEAIRLATSE